MSVINTNITSMIGQQNLNESKNALATSMERLSSGLRINSAKDDAAGQAIANRMSAQITGLSQAQRNANDGISVAQTAEGALNQVNDNLQRIRELSVQAQNGTNSDADLQSIQDEIGQRLSEIDRISEETSFNGTKVLSEENALQIQVGANDGEAISVGLQEITSATLKLDDFTVAGAKAATETDLKSIDNLQEIETVDGVTKYAKTTDTLATAKDVLNDNVLTSNAGGTEGKVVADGKTYAYTASDEFTLTDADKAAGVVASELTPSTGINEVTVDFGQSSSSQSIKVRIDDQGNLTNEAGEKLKLTGTDQSDAELVVAGDGDTQATIEDVADIVALSAADNTTTITDGDSVYAGDGTPAVGIDKTTTFTASQLIDELDGKAMTVTDDSGATNTYNISADGKVSQSGDAVYVDADDGTSLVAGSASGGFTEEYYLQENGTVNTQQDGNGDTVYFEKDSDTGVKNLTTDPETKATANQLEAIDSALNQVDSLRSELGAVQNRFESAITNLQTNETNLSAARSRIEDADYATEVANMTRAQILQQAGTSVLAQANQLPQNALSLLG